MTVDGAAVRRLAWRQLHWPQPLDPERALATLRAWAADQHSPRLVLEARATDHRVGYLLGAPLAALLSAQRRLCTAIPDVRLTAVASERASLAGARRLKLSTRHRPLRFDQPEEITRGVLGALSQVGRDETLVLQVVLGPRRIPLAVPTNSPSSTIMPWYQVAWRGRSGTVDGDKRTALRNKVGDHGFAATIRIGVAAATADRRRELVLSVFSALRVSEAPGVQHRLVRDSSRKTSA